MGEEKLSAAKAARRAEMKAIIDTVGEAEAALEDAKVRLAGTVLTFHESWEVRVALLKVGGMLEEAREERGRARSRGQAEETLQEEGE